MSHKVVPSLFWFRPSLSSLVCSRSILSSKLKSYLIHRLFSALPFPLTAAAHSGSPSISGSLSAPSLSSLLRLRVFCFYLLLLNLLLTLRLSLQFSPPSHPGRNHSAAHESTYQVTNPTQSVNPTHSILPPISTHTTHTFTQSINQSHSVSMHTISPFTTRTFSYCLPRPFPMSPFSSFFL